jgi:hypothetical protein
MSWRWIIGDYHDPSWRLSRLERRDLNRIAVSLPGATSRMLLQVIPAICFLLLIMQVIAMLSLRRWGMVWIIPLSLAVLVLGLQVLSARIWKPVYERAYQVMRLQRCGNCEYELIEHDDMQRPCPECGTPPAALRCPDCRAWMPRLAQHDGLCPECASQRPGGPWRLEPP